MTTHIKPRRASVTIYHGDDLETLGELQRAAEIEKRREIAMKQARRAVAEDEDNGSAGRMGDDWNDGDAELHDVGTEAREAYNAFVDEAAARAVEVVVESLGRGRFRDLIEDHPVRKTTITVKPEPTDDNPEPAAEEREIDEPEDVLYGGRIFLGANVTTYPEALLTFDDGERRTIVEPEFKSAAALKRFLDDELDEDDYDRIWLAAHGLNRGSAADPKDKIYTLTSTAT